MKVIRKPKGTAKRCIGKIKLGNVNLPPDEFQSKNIKARVNMWVDGDILDAYRSAAEKRGIGYQTLMNEKLRESLEGLDKTLSDRVSDLERIVKSASKR